MLWFLATAVFVVAITVAVGPMRPGFLLQLQNHPQFFVETLLGVLITVVCAWSALSLSVPRPGSRVKTIVPLLLFGVWIGFLVYGLWHPALEPAMTGKRELCLYETILYAIPPFALISYMLRRGVTFNLASAGTLTGIAACALPATIMQIACMYDPQHILRYHIAPVAGLAVVGALLGLKLFRPSDTSSL